MRLLALLSYRLLSRWLPASTAPGGNAWRSLRRVTASPLLVHAGEGVNIERGAFFGAGQVSLGDRSGIGIDCHLKGPVTIGRNVMMGPEVVVFTTGHEFADTTRPMIEQGATAARPVTIEDDVWIGQRAMLMPGVTVGAGSIVGAGSVVTKDVPPLSVVAGNPARVIRTREG